MKKMILESTRELIRRWGYMSPIDLGGGGGMGVDGDVREEEEEERGRRRKVMGEGEVRALMKHQQRERGGLDFSGEDGRLAATRRAFARLTDCLSRLGLFCIHIAVLFPPAFV